MIRYYYIMIDIMTWSYRSFKVEICIDVNIDVKIDR